MESEKSGYYSWEAKKKRVTAWEVSTSWEETEESFIGVEDTKEKSDYKLRSRLL